MKKRLTRILCGMLCAALALGNAAFAQEAVTSQPDAVKDEKTSEAVPEEKTEENKEEKKGLRYDADAAYPVFSGYIPDYSGYASHQYEVFMDILQLYVDTHLYEFSNEQLTEAFLMKLLKENPELMAFFLNTLLTTMDPYSGYYEAGQGLASDGSNLGYGIVMADETNGNIKAMGLTTPGLYIEEVVKDSPAEKAGIMMGDRVVSVEGIPLEGVTFDAASYLIRYQPYIEEEIFDALGNSLGIPNEPEFEIIDEKTGKKRYFINLEVERKGEIIPIKMKKDRVIYSNVRYEKVAEKTYSRITMSSFTGDSDVEDFRAALERAKKDGTGNLLIDLRDNAGGRLESAIAIANMLIPEKDRIICYFNSRDREEPEPIYSIGGGYKFDKITVLVNGYTASASELLAMALNYNSGATIIGTKTFGKAVGQQGYNFINGDMFTITSMEMLDPLKRSYHTVGLMPDVEIDYCLDKYDFPSGVAEFVFVPDNVDMTVNGEQAAAEMTETQESAEPAQTAENTVTAEPEAAPETADNAGSAGTAGAADVTGTADPTEVPAEEEIVPTMSFKEGDSSDNILALEMRLSILGFLRDEEVDGVFESATLSAVKAFELYMNGKPEGILDEEEAGYINSRSDSYKDYYYKYDSQLEVAEMSFRSTSQARRRAKELLNESKKIQKEYDAYLKAEEEKIKAEEKAAEEKAEQEKAELEKAEQEKAEQENAGSVPETQPAVTPEGN